MDETIEIKVTSDLAGKRLDVILAEQCDDLTRSYINKLCKEERAKLNDKISKGNKKCKEGDKITLQIPEPEELEILPEKMDLDIVYEDQDVILINKPKNMVVHPAAGHYTGTLVNGLMAHCKDDLSGINGVLRPGIVHRIDKDTTGILIVCKNDMAHQSIAKQLYDHSITRKYHAIVYGNIKEEEGTVNAPIGRSLKDRKKMGIVMDGKHAVTHYKVLRRLKKGFTYIECQLETGRNFLFGRCRTTLFDRQCDERRSGSRNHTTKSSRLFPSREGRRSRRLSFNRISSRFGSRNGRLRGVGIRSRFQIPQPGYYSSRWNYRANDGKSGTSAFPQTPYRRRNKGTKSVGDIRKNQKSEEKCHHLSRTRSGNYGAE